MLAISYAPIQRVLGFSPHGIASAVGFLLGASLLLRELRRRDFDTKIAERALTWAAVGAVLGARLDYVISQPQAFFGEGGDPMRVFRVWEGGLALFGGFIGGVLAALPVLRRARVHLPRFLDAAAPGFALGVVIGRIGDLVIADHLGNLATGWGRAIGYTIREGYELAPGFEPSPAITGECASHEFFYAGCTYHQPAAYDMLGALLLLGLLLLLRRNARFRAGALICVWGAWYGLQRFVIDFTRSQVDEHIPVIDLTGTQVLGLLLSLVCLVTLVRIKRRGRGLGERPEDPPSREGALVRDEPAPDVPADPQDGSASDASSTPSANPLA